MRTSALQGLTVHGDEELLVALAVHDAVAEGVHSLDGIHFGDELADYPHAVEGGLVLQEVVATSG